jgi:hypothetical protein
MRRFIAAYAVFLGATMLACSSPPGEKIASTSSAQTACDVRSEIVTLTGFDSDTLVLTVVNGDGEQLSIQYTGDTSAVAANLGEYEPPDPCFGQATAWNHQIGRGLMQAVIERLAHFAKFSCNARVSLGGDNVVLSLKPVPFPPNPI